jgi:hypothetical protein
MSLSASMNSGLRVCGNVITTPPKVLTNFRKVINRCVRNGWLPKDPFANFKMTLREVERIALTETERQTLIAQ